MCVCVWVVFRMILTNAIGLSIDENVGNHCPRVLKNNIVFMLITKKGMRI